MHFKFKDAIKSDNLNIQICILSDIKHAEIGQPGTPVNVTYTVKLSDHQLIRIEAYLGQIQSRGVFHFYIQL